MTRFRSGMHQATFQPSIKDPILTGALTQMNFVLIAGSLGCSLYTDTIHDFHEKASRCQPRSLVFLALTDTPRCRPTGGRINFPSFTFLGRVLTACDYVHCRLNGRRACHVLARLFLLPPIRPASIRTRRGAVGSGARWGPQSVSGAAVSGSSWSASYFGGGPFRHELAVTRTRR